MFGIDLSELMVILVITLIVVGPERLPKVARTLGHLWGRAQRYVNNVKADIARDMAVEEFRQLQQKVQQEADIAKQAVTQTAQTVDQQIQQINDAVGQSAETVMQAAPGQSTAATQPHSLPNSEPAGQQKLPID